MFRFFFLHIPKSPSRPPGNPFNVFPRTSPKNISWFENYLIKNHHYFESIIHNRVNLHVPMEKNIHNLIYIYYELWSCWYINVKNVRLMNFFNIIFLRADLWLLTGLIRRCIDWISCRLAVLPMTGSTATSLPFRWQHL